MIPNYKIVYSFLIQRATAVDEKSEVYFQEFGIFVRQSKNVETEEKS